MLFSKRQSQAGLRVAQGLGQDPLNRSLNSENSDQILEHHRHCGLLIPEDIQNSTTQGSEPPALVWPASGRGLD